MAQRRVLRPDADPFPGKDAFDVEHVNPFDPSRGLTRQVMGGVPQRAFTDAQIIGSPDYPSMRIELEGSHNDAHIHRRQHRRRDTALRDPFVFLLHSNVDRLFAMWQYADPIQRLDPMTVYGVEPEHPFWYGRTLNPWDSAGWTRPWVAPEFEDVEKDYLDPSIVTPPRYDTLPLAGDGQAVHRPEAGRTATPARRPDRRPGGQDPSSRLARAIPPA